MSCVLLYYVSNVTDCPFILILVLKFTISNVPFAISPGQLKYVGTVYICYSTVVVYMVTVLLSKCRHENSQ